MREPNLTLEATIWKNTFIWENRNWKPEYWNQRNFRYTWIFHL